MLNGCFKQFDKSSCSFTPRRDFIAVQRKMMEHTWLTLWWIKMICCFVPLLKLQNPVPKKKKKLLTWRWIERNVRLFTQLSTCNVEVENMACKCQNTIIKYFFRDEELILICIKYTCRDCRLLWSSSAMPPSCRSPLLANHYQKQPSSSSSLSSVVLSLFICC